MSEARFTAANSVLAIIAEGTTIEPRKGGVWVMWKQYSGKQMERRWVCRGQDFYPMWHRHWGQGGTRCTALAQLVRWCQGKTCLPLSTWRYWTGKSVAMGSERADELLSTLESAGYPVTVNCVLCRQPISGPLDWWSLNKVVGPCCGMSSGCRQKKAAAQ